MLNKALLDLTKETFAFLIDLAESGHVETFGLPMSPERIEKHLCQVLQESLNILQHEDETVSIEHFGGITAVRKLVSLKQAVQKLPENMRPQLELTLSQTIRQQSKRGRPARTVRPLKKDTP